MHTLLQQLGGGAGSDFAGMPLLPSFDRPAWLLLIVPLCAVAWWIARRSLSGWDLSRQKAHLVVRWLVIAAVCAALAQPQLRWRASDIAVVAVMDVSDSVPPEQQRLADEFLQGSLAKRPAQDRFGMVTVADGATVQSLPSHGSNGGSGVERPNPTGSGEASRLQRGVELGRAIVPADAAGRVLLISDGNQTAGDLAGAAATLRSSGVPLDVAAIEYDRSKAIRVEDVVVPAWARDGDTITVRTIVQAGTPALAHLTLLLDGEPLDLDPTSDAVSAPVTLDAGPNVLIQQVRLPPGPVHRVEAVLSPDGNFAAGAVPQLLRAEGVTFTSDRGRVLVLSEDTQAAAPLVAALSTESLRVEVRPAAAAPSGLAEWAGYDAVVLVDEPASNFSQAQQEDMVRAVRDAGNGLLVVGGPNSYGAGGWIGSPLADALPLLLDPPAKRLMPMGALALVIDRSGSMAAQVGGTGMSQQEIANEAAILAVRSLSREDQVVVVTFSGDFTVDVPLVRRTDMGYLERAIRSIGPGGGTNLFPAIDAAAAELAKSPAGVKHIIVLSDGATVGDINDGVTRTAALRGAGITLSTVAIGDGADATLMRRLARAGGGRMNVVRNESSRAVLPQILIKEAQTVRRTLIWEGSPFAPTLGAGAEALRGISGPFPAITGYVVTADRPGLSVVELRGPEGDPILAQWQHGLGRVVAYTSDAGTRWNAAWSGWGSATAFWQQHLRWAMRPSGDPNARITITQHDDRAHVTLDLLDSAGHALNFARITSRVAPPSVPNSGDAQHDRAKHVEFRQVGPGRYQADVAAAAVGSHLLSLRYEAGVEGAQQKQTGSVRAAITRRSGEEFRQPTPDFGLLAELATRTGGRMYRLDPAGVDLWVRENLKMPEIARSAWTIVAILCLALFLLDVAARRVVIDLASIKAKLLGAVSRGAPAGAGAAATLTTLAGAKQRAERAITERRTETPAARPSRLTESATPTPLTPTTPTTPTATHPATSALATPEPAPRRPRGNPPASETHDPLTSSAPPTPDDVMSRLRAAKRRSAEDADRSSDPG